MIHLNLTEGATGNTLLYMLTKETSMPSENLLLLTPSGLAVPHNLSIEQTLILASPEPHLYLYTISEHKTVQSYLQQPLHIPELVTCFLKDARRSVQDYHQKKMFIHGYHFVSEQFHNLASLKAGLKVLYNHLTTRIKDIVDESNQLKPRQEKMNARFELFKESHQHDQVRYQEQASRKDRITSKKMVNHWDKTEKDLQLLTQEVTSRVDLVHETVQDVNKRLIEAKTREVLTQVSEDPELQNLVSKSVLLYSMLRRERASTRQDTTARQIAQVVVRMLKRRDVVRLACYTELVSLTECLGQVTDLDLAATLLDKDLAQADAAISKAQLRRQSDVWTLLAAAVKHSPAGQQAQLDQSVRRDLAQSDRIIQENEAVRRRLETSYLNNPPVDWDSLLD